jgi:hypothetical protein
MLRRFFIITALLLSASVVQAQSIAPDPVQYTVSPEQPGPNQQVTIQVSGVGQFLGNSNITWQQDGKIISNASNQPSFTFTTGGIGTATRIHLSINSPTQGAISHDFVFNPSVVNLVWEADTYTPLLYQGKALYTPGSALKVVAFPTVMIGGTVVPTSKLSFQWSHNDTPEPASSGLGKNIFIFRGDQLQKEEAVSVLLYSGSAPVGRGEIIIPASVPQIILYVQDPLRGELLDQGLQGNTALGTTETTFKAEPYFFSNNAVLGGKLQYEWTLNNQDTTGPDAANGLLTLRQTGTAAGSANLGVSIQNTSSSQLAQTANSNLQLIFGTQTGSALSNFFGL